jgi:uncharacterized circularly permuted ATP-grasp superfamily protein
VRPGPNQRASARHRAIGTVELTKRWEQGRRLIRENGVTYNVYGDPRGMDRPWVLDPIPHVLAADEWHELVAGLDSARAS